MTVVDGFRLLSNSEVQAFKLCLRKWWLAWHRGMAPREKEVTGIRSTGTRLHIGLEARYQPGVLGDRTAVLTALRAAQEADMRVLLERSWSTAQLEKDSQLEVIMLDGYLDWLKETGEDSFLEVVDSEAYLEAVLPGTSGQHPVKIIGKLDLRLIDTRTGRRRFMDHKSVTTFKVPNLRQNGQLLHYHLLELLSATPFDQRCDVALYNMLRRVKRGPNSKPPFYMRVEVEPNKHEIANYGRQLAGTATRMDRLATALDKRPEDHQFYAPPTTGAHCSWKCPFNKVCPMFDDGSRAEAALEADFQQINPLDYYQGREREEVEE